MSLSVLWAQATFVLMLLQFQVAESCRQNVHHRLWLCALLAFKHWLKRALPALRGPTLRRYSGLIHKTQEVVPASKFFSEGQLFNRVKSIKPRHSKPFYNVFWNCKGFVKPLTLNFHTENQESIARQRPSLWQITLRGRGERCTRKRLSVEFRKCSILAGSR